MVNVETMSGLVPPPLPSRNTSTQSNGPRRPSLSNRGRPLPPTPKSPAYQNFELPKSSSSKLKKSETVPSFTIVNDEPPALPSPRSKSVKVQSKRALPPVPNEQCTTAAPPGNEAPALPPPRAATLSRRNPHSPLPPPPLQQGGSDEESLDERFRFHDVNDLPPPEEFTSSKKTYASKQKRGPPE